MVKRGPFNRRIPIFLGNSIWTGDPLRMPFHRLNNLGVLVAVGVRVAEEERPSESSSEVPRQTPVWPTPDRLRRWAMP